MKAKKEKKAYLNPKKKKKKKSAIEDERGMRCLVFEFVALFFFPVSPGARTETKGEIVAAAASVQYEEERRRKKE